MNHVCLYLRSISAACIAALFATSAFALNVVYDKGTPQGHRDWAERSHLREHMEVAAKRICEALYGDEPRSRMHENFTISHYLAPTRGGNPAFASGRKITWKVGEHPGGGELTECPGIIRRTARSAISTRRFPTGTSTESSPKLVRSGAS